MLADCERDIYPMFARKPEAIDFVVPQTTPRAGRWRYAIRGHRQPGRRSAGYKIKVAPKRPGDKGCKARLILKARTVTIKRPHSNSDRQDANKLKLRLLEERDGSTRPATDVIEADDIKAAAAISATLEGSTKRQKNPHKKGTLGWLSWIAARLGGWNCYYKPPGPKIMALDLDRLIDRIEGFRLVNEQSRREISRGSVYHEPVAVSARDLGRAAPGASPRGVAYAEGWLPRGARSVVGM